MDSENANWTISPFAEFLLKENQKSNPTELDADDLKLYNEYKEGYVANFKKDSTETTYLAMPFKINNQLFLDFIPIEDREFNESDNNLYKMHLISIHTLAKVDIESDSSVSIKWLAQSKLEALLKENTSIDINNSKNDKYYVPKGMYTIQIDDEKTTFEVK